MRKEGGKKPVLYLIANYLLLCVFAVGIVAPSSNVYIRYSYTLYIYISF